MKREEASRYISARRNPDFLEKVIKPRSLGPEHAENQLRLRKGIKVRDKMVRRIDTDESLNSFKQSALMT
jgi:nucleoporin NUP159